MDQQSKQPYKALFLTAVTSIRYLQQISTTRRPLKAPSGLYFVKVCPRFRSALKIFLPKILMTFLEKGKIRSNAAKFLSSGFKNGQRNLFHKIMSLINLA